MALKLYFDYMSQPSRAVAMFLLHNKIPFEPKPVKLARGEHTSSEFEQLNPFRKVPVMTDGDFTLTESIAILRYLCREKNVPDHWYPKGSKDQAKVDEFLEWQHLNTRMFCSRFFLSKFLMPMVTGKQPRPEKIEHLQSEMETNLELIEDVWLRGDKPFLTGANITIADILGACEVEQPRMGGFDARTGRPKLTAWMDRVRSYMNPHYDEVHGKLYGICEKYKGAPPSSTAKL